MTFNNATRAHNFTLASNRVVPNWESQNKHLRYHSVWPITKDTDKPVNQSKPKVHVTDENRGKTRACILIEWKSGAGLMQNQLLFDMKTALFSVHFSNFVNSTIQKLTLTFDIQLGWTLNVLSGPMLFYGKSLNCTLRFWVLVQRFFWFPWRRREV